MNTSGQPITNGRPIRCSLSLTKPQLPRRGKLMRAKKPAIRKKVVIRKTWMVKDSRPRVTLGWVSWMIQNRGEAGTNDNVACRTMPSSRAPPLTASRAWSLSDTGAEAVEWDMDRLVPLDGSLCLDRLTNRRRAFSPDPKIG